MKIFKTVMLIITATGSGNVNAALLERLGGLAYYDDLADLTWLADANYAQTSGYDVDGRMTWAEAVDWAAELEVAGVDSWRLADGSGCVGYNCTNTEMGNLFYDALGNTGGSLISSTGPFSNIQAHEYWIGPTWDDGSVWHFTFNMADGEMWEGTRASYNYAWAVHAGDVGNAVSTVPLPATVWLFASGLVALFASARRRKS